VQHERLWLWVPARASLGRDDVLNISVPHCSRRQRGVRLF
jgi:hypothetical protein